MGIISHDPNIANHLAECEKRDRRDRQAHCSLSRSDLFRNSLRTTVPQKSELRVAIAVGLRLNPGCRERNFWMQRQSAKNRLCVPKTQTRT